MKRTLVLFAVPVLAISALAWGGPGTAPETRRPAAESVCTCPGCAGVATRRLDPRVADAIVDVSRTMPNDDRVRVLTVLATNPGLRADTALKIIDIARIMPNEDRTVLLMALATNDQACD